MEDLFCTDVEIWAIKSELANYFQVYLRYCAAWTASIAARI